MLTFYPVELLMEPLLGRTSQHQVTCESYQVLMQRRAAEAARKVPLHRRLLPRSLRARLAQRAESRAMTASFSRLNSLSPHLLDDIGIQVSGGPAGFRVRPEPSPAPERQPAQVQPVMPAPASIAAE